MPFNSREENTYLDIVIREALKNWDPAKPRRWLARYGSLHTLGIGHGDNAQKYRDIQAQALLLTDVASALKVLAHFPISSTPIGERT